MKMVVAANKREIIDNDMILVMIVTGTCVLITSLGLYDSKTNPL